MVIEHRPPISAQKTKEIIATTEIKQQQQQPLWMNIIINLYFFKLGSEDFK